MGNPASKNSLQNTKQNSVNFIQSSRYKQNSSQLVFSQIRKQQKLERHTSFYKIYMELWWNLCLTNWFFQQMETNYSFRKTSKESIMKELPRSLHQYKFIVDGEWRFSPEDLYIPDTNGNINNYIDTTNFHKMIDQSSNKPKNREEIYDTTDPDLNFRGIQEFNKYAPRIPSNYLNCSFLRSLYYDQVKTNEENTEMEDENIKFQESLNEKQIMLLFNTSHCLPQPFHVQVEHLISENNEQQKGYSSFAITQRFKSKYTTYRHFNMKNNV